jgi:hypothetical protein
MALWPSYRNVWLRCMWLMLAGGGVCSGHQQQPQQPQHCGSTTVAAVSESGTPLPTELLGWSRLLARTEPLVFRAAAPVGTEQPGDGGESGGDVGHGVGRALAAATRAWSWEAIGRGLGEHTMAFIGQPGQRAFPYFEGNMPLEGVPARRSLGYAEAERRIMSGTELIGRLLRSGGGPKPPAEQQRLLYSSQSMSRLKDGEEDARASGVGPQPPIGRGLLRAMRGLSQVSNNSLAVSAALWLGSAGVTTPLHYDTSHNIFVQLHGRKRASLLPPSRASQARLFPSLHPGYRQAQLDITAPALADGGGPGTGRAATVLTPRQAQAARELAGQALRVSSDPLTTRPGSTDKNAPLN